MPVNDAYKTCRRCLETKPREAFYANRKLRDSLHSYCKTCCNASAKESSKKSAGSVCKSWKIVGVKLCGKCAVVKRDEEFYRGTPHECKECCKARVKVWGVEHLERYRANCQESKKRARAEGRPWALGITPGNLGDNHHVRYYRRKEAEKLRLQKVDRSRRGKNAGLAAGVKYCKRCDATKSLEEFSIDRRRPDGRGYKCKPCRNESEQHLSPRPRTLRAQSMPGRSGYVYLLRSEIGLYKIGRSKSPLDRVEQLKCGIPIELELLHSVSCEDYFRAEAELHRRYAPKRVKGEWFRLDAEDVETIKRVATM